MPEKIFYGTYRIHNIGRTQGIQMPATFTGSYSIYSNDGGETMLLVKQGEKEV